MQKNIEKTAYGDEQFKIVLFKLGELYGTYSFIIRKGLFSDIFIKDFIDVMSEYLLTEMVDVEVIESDEKNMNKVLCNLIE